MSIISESEKDGCGDVRCKVACLMPIAVGKRNLITFLEIKLIIYVPYCRTVHMYIIL